MIALIEKLRKRNRVPHARTPLPSPPSRAEPSRGVAWRGEASVRTMSCCGEASVRASDISPLHLFPVELLWFIPVPNLCTHRDRESRPLEPDALHRDTCSGVRAIRFFESIFRDCSLPRIGEIDFFPLHWISYLRSASFWW